MSCDVVLLVFPARAKKELWVTLPNMRDHWMSPDTLLKYFRLRFKTRIWCLPSQARLVLGTLWTDRTGIGVR